jgi:hypothetical protein
MGRVPTPIAAEPFLPDSVSIGTECQVALARNLTCDILGGAQKIGRRSARKHNTEGGCYHSAGNFPVP